MNSSSDRSQVRDAASVVICRAAASGPEILMGQRGAKAAFMPNKFVFPGGAVDPDDADMPLRDNLPDPCHSRLAQGISQRLAHALPVAAVREVMEETGLLLGEPGHDGAAPWKPFQTAGYVPSAKSMRFVFRAVTPPGRSRRFDARFFLAPAEGMGGDAAGFTGASDELSHLQWISVERARKLDLAFITKVVLAEIEPLLSDPAPPASVPWVENDDPVSDIRRLV